MNLHSACILVVVLGCHESAAVGTATTTSLGIIDNTQAVNLVAYSRCNRESACEHIGAQGRRWESFDACLHDLTRDTGASLGLERCPQGVLADRMDECLKDMREQRCDKPLDSLETLASCRTRYVCPGSR